MYKPGSVATNPLKGPVQKKKRKQGYISTLACCAKLVYAFLFFSRYLIDSQNSQVPTDSTVLLSKRPPTNKNYILNHSCSSASLALILFSGLYSSSFPNRSAKTGFSSLGMSLWNVFLFMYQSPGANISTSDRALCATDGW